MKFSHLKFSVGIEQTFSYIGHPNDLEYENTHS